MTVNVAGALELWDCFFKILSGTLRMAESQRGWLTFAGTKYDVVHHMEGTDVYFRVLTPSSVVYLAV